MILLKGIRALDHQARLWGHLWALAPGVWPSRLQLLRPKASEGWKVFREPQHKGPETTYHGVSIPAGFTAVQLAQNVEDGRYIWDHLAHLPHWGRWGKGVYQPHQSENSAPDAQPPTLSTWTQPAGTIICLLLWFFSVLSWPSCFASLPVSATFTGNRVLIFPGQMRNTAHSY